MIDNGIMFTHYVSELAIRIGVITFGPPCILIAKFVARFNRKVSVSYQYYDECKISSKRQLWNQLCLLLTIIFIIVFTVNRFHERSSV